MKTVIDNNLRERAVEMVKIGHMTCGMVARKLGVSKTAVKSWVKLSRIEVDAWGTPYAVMPTLKNITR